MKLRQEWRALVRGTRALNPQTTCVLVLCAVLVAIQFKLGSRRFFLAEIAPSSWREHRELLSWAWWFMVQGVMGFLVPVLVLRLAFRRPMRAIGLGLGDWRLAGTLALLYLPLVAVGTWVLSDGASFQAEYPHFRGAVADWRLFAAYHVLFLLYWIGWEYLWRGFVLFGTAHTFGPYAIFIQAVPFALLHLAKADARTHAIYRGRAGAGSFSMALPILLDRGPDSCASDAAVGPVVRATHQDRCYGYRSWSPCGKFLLVSEHVVDCKVGQCPYAHLQRGFVCKEVWRVVSRPPKQDPDLRA